MRNLSLISSMLRGRGSHSTTPRLLTFITTFRCNARCVMCDSWKKEPGYELTAGEIDSIFAQLPRLDTVRLSGGEPFVRSDLGDVAASAQRRLRPMYLHITTNGLLTDRITRFCEERPRDVPLYLLVSIDGMRERHEAIRGVPGAWDRAMSTLRALAPRRDELRLRLAVNQTIVDTDGIREFPELDRELDALDVAHFAVMAYDVSSTYNVQGEVETAPGEAGEFTTFGEFDRGELERFLGDAAQSFRRLPLPERLAKDYYLAGLRGRLLEGRARPNPACVALRAHLRLLPDGDVPTCQFNTRTVGNLRTTPFEKVWEAERANAQRKWVDGCPGCWAECEVLPNAVYSGDLLRSFARLRGGRNPTAVGPEGRPVVAR